MLKLIVKTKDKNYNVIIGKNLINKIESLLKKEINKCVKILLIIDSKVPKKFISVIKTKLKKFSIYLIIIKNNEKNKNINTSLKIVDFLLTKNFNRNDCLISIGGGIVGDISGFAASIAKRGLKFINIPTTLLSQVDSSVGGKTGVNSKFGKNLIGTYYQPNLVLSDIDFLSSLPQREIICGYAEILKHALILDKKFFLWLNKNGKKIIKLKNKELIRSIYCSCKIKISIIQKDEKEKNLRQILNFGHTFAHAFESTKKFSKILNHGEAVLLGIICALKYAFSNKLIKKKDLDLIKNHYSQLNLQQDIKTFFTKKNINELLKFMQKDKKNINKEIKLVLIRNIGKTPSLVLSPTNKIKKFLINQLS